MKESTVRARNGLKTAYTGGQLAIDKIVKEMGFSTDVEKEFPPYFVDVYVYSIHAGIEYDGAHSFKKKDRERDNYLMEKYKLPIKRLEFFAPKEKVKEALIPFLKECALKSSRKQL